MRPTNTAVQANSLSSLTTLASNPPRYPRNPTQETREPLVLYIARVPGSKDVFLSTMKPRHDVVTAQDVSSSLYYLHVDQMGDDALQDDFGALDGIRAGAIDENDGKLQEAQVPRKPVPDQPELHLESKPDVPPRRSLESNTQQYQDVGHINRKPVTGPLPPTNLVRQGRDADDVPQRRPVASDHTVKDLGDHPISQARPLGPRPQVRSPSVRKPVPGTENMRLGERIQSSQEKEPKVESPPFSPVKSSSTNDQWTMAANHVPTPLYDSSSSDKIERSNHKKSDSSTSLGQRQRLTTPDGKDSAKDSLGGYSVKLIRRDLTSGGQWNVGRILVETEDALETLPPASTVNSVDGPRPVPNAQSIDIEISNPGYGKFIGSAMPSVGLSLNAEGRASLDVPREPRSQQKQAAPDGVFRRQVNLDASPSRSRNRKTSLGSKDWSGDNNPIRRSAHAIIDGGQQFGIRSVQGLSSFDDFEPESSRKRAKGYFFRSPWDGRCEFSTGLAGRSLKCKHTLPNTGTSEPSPSVTVSDLRFNLPRPPIFNSASSGASNLPKASNEIKKASLMLNQKLQKHLSPHHEASTSNSLANDDPDRMDLTLGQEKAGGGSRGKSAKLGKLVIEDEGLRMLDLIVAANMGVWWTIYERAASMAH
ncbi:MAG: hypothetical protein M1837_005212 [Sclerophora amabilis]|nr:MAG: hypothetical protein M1837_005212 [Sclerophora amabilis]